MTYVSIGSDGSARTGLDMEEKPAVLALDWKETGKE
jgi:hypothetical protein